MDGIVDAMDVSNVHPLRTPVDENVHCGATLRQEQDRGRHDADTTRDPGKDFEDLDPPNGLVRERVVHPEAPHVDGQSIHDCPHGACDEQDPERYMVA